MRAVVTGCAGFIGSHLVEALVDRGDSVVGIDCFTPYYDPGEKRRNLALVRSAAPEAFELVEADLRAADLRTIVDGADALFHLAAQPGVRLSWSDGFAQYDSCNVLATQRVLEAAIAVRTPRVVFASSSSVYGPALRYPTTEADLPHPHSPYGVTKLAAEHLCGLYAANHGLSTVALRYFTVYGPRQRPDMALRRLLEAGIKSTSFPLYGDGSALRDFTFVSDVVSANLAAADADVAPGLVANIAGGGETSLATLIELAADAIGRPITIDRQPPQAGDVPRTAGSIDRAHRILGWSPRVALADGVRAEGEWLLRTVT